MKVQDGRQKRQGWLFKACLGLLALTVTAAATLFALFAMGLGPTPPSEDRRARTFERLIETAAPTLAAENAASPALRSWLVLDLAAPRIDLVPGPAGTPLRIEAEYDHSAFELSEEFAQASDGTWTYGVRFGPSFYGARRVLIAHRDPPSLRIVVPRDLPLSLEARIRHGHSDFELGGLTLG